MSLKVLIVDDDVSILDLMSEVLTSEDIEVTPMNDSESAAALVQKKRFDGIFLDLQMPKIGGLELAKRIRQTSLNKTTPVIVVTGEDERTIMQQAFGAGATFFLQKPIDRLRLLRLLSTVQGSMMSNRRRFIRVPVETEVVVEARGEKFKGITRNISQDGMLFEPARLSSGDPVRLVFSLPGVRVTISASGVVVRIEEPQRAGVQFTSLSDSSRNAIREIIDRQAA
jgi:CheY-like chemotaxis protein